MAEPATQLGTPPAPAGGSAVYLLAGWGRRAAAYAIDLAILLVPLIAVWSFLLPSLIRDAVDDPRLEADWDVFVESEGDEVPLGRFVYWSVLILLAATAVYWLIIGLYSAAFAASTQGQTPGRRAVGIRLMRTDGARITFWWALYRTLVVREVLFGLGSILTGGLLQLAQYLWPLGDVQRRTLHDMVSRSRVVLEPRDPR
ncbi:MAG: RDD family protein [Solirubrobacteraceae bacterium]|nr:RDD family protein [Solirubrobacteraceae bacterium]